MEEQITKINMTTLTLNEWSLTHPMYIVTMTMNYQNDQSWLGDFGVLFGYRKSDTPSKVRMLLQNSVIPESIINIHKIQNFLYLIFVLIPKGLIKEQIINPYYKIYNPGIKHAYKSHNTQTVGYMIMNNDILVVSYIKSINPQYCSISINPTKLYHIH